MVGNDEHRMSFGARLQRHRKRVDMSRPVLGGLVGKSGEWVKALETGRLLTPRLPQLLRLADVLGIDGPADVTDLSARGQASLGAVARRP